MAQLVQALASLVLQVVAVRALGAEGLGAFGLLYGGLILASALVSGLVGDALTVLDRQQPAVRSGLQVVAVTVAVAAGAVSALLAGATGLLTWWTALLFALAIAVFVVEELLRRALMASLRFWLVVAVDAACLVGTGLFLLGAAQTGPLDMADLWASLVFGQGIGLLIAIGLLPARDRWLAPWRGGDVRSVIGFGGWRAAQQAVRPVTLTLTRTLIVLATSTAAFGELEAARVYTAPTMLIVSGAVSFLFASYAADKGRPLSELLRRADVGAGVLVAFVIVVGGAATALAPWAGGLVTDGTFDLDAIAVFGWVVFAASASVLTPYGQLGAVAGLQVTVFTIRGLEAVVSVAAVVVVVSVAGASASWAPYALAAGSVISGAVIRQGVLRPRADAGHVTSGPTRPLGSATPGAEVLGAGSLTHQGGDVGGQTLG